MKFVLVTPLMTRSIKQPLVAEFPHLKVVMEHITTKEAVEFVQRASGNIAATITCHHLLHNRNGEKVCGLHDCPTLTEATPRLFGQTSLWAASGRTCTACRS